MTDGSDRILHMNDRCREFVEVCRKRCAEMGISERFENALDYLRTWGNAPESKMKSVLMLDLPHSEDRMDFICVINRRVYPPEEAPSGDNISGMKHVITIGMVWRSEEKTWSFHS